MLFLAPSHFQHLNFNLNYIDIYALICTTKHVEIAKRLFFIAVVVIEMKILMQMLEVIFPSQYLVLMRSEMREKNNCHEEEETTSIID